MTLKEMFEIICGIAGKRVRFINIPFSLAKLCVESVYILSAKKVDYREKLDRLMENRAYGHEVIAADLGYKPESFEKRVEPLIEALKAERKVR